MDQQITKKFLDALHSGKVCLHPTDTIPGITLDPLKKNFREEISFLKKGRSLEKPPVCLSSSLEKAKLYWQPLPRVWEEVLEGVWPNALTVIWNASPKAPTNICSAKNTVAIRVPKSVPDWLLEVLSSTSVPLPSTSVNLSGESPILNWEDAVSFLEKFDNVFIPKTKPDEFQTMPSTLIEITGEKSYRMLRQGSFQLDHPQVFEDKQ